MVEKIAERAFKTTGSPHDFKAYDFVAVGDIFKIIKLQDDDEVIWRVEFFCENHANLYILKSKA
jgi:hypothetical protein